MNQKWCALIAPSIRSFLIAFILLLTRASLDCQSPGCKDTLHAELSFLPRQPGSATVDEARDFLWRHWSERRCGTLFLTAFSREGQRTDSIYTLEPGPKEAMLLKVTLHRSAVAQLHTPAETISNIANVVERVKPEIPSHVETARTIRGDDPLPPSAYRLRFKDEQGKVITDF